MDSNQLVSEGFNLMLIGMGFVFVFLTLLVIITAVMSRIVLYYEKRFGSLPKEGIPAPTAVLGFHNQPSNTPKDANLVSVLSGAIHRYRAKHKK